MGVSTLSTHIIARVAVCVEAIQKPFGRSNNVVAYTGCFFIDLISLVLHWAQFAGAAHLQYPFHAVIFRPTVKT